MILTDIRDARIIVELSNRLSFGSAAAILGMPAATLSRRLQKIERRAGVRLFARTTRAVSVTESGKLIVGYAKRIIAEADAAEAAFSSMHDQPGGIVRISAPVILGQAILGPVLAGFIEKHPKCDLVVDLSDRHVNFVEENYDVGFRVGPAGDESLILKRVGHVVAGLYGSPNTVAKLADPLQVETLQASEFGLLYDGGRTEPSLELTSQDGLRTRLDLRPRLICLNPWLLLEVALNSNLVVVLPDIVARQQCSQGNLERVLPGWCARSVPVSIAFTSRKLLHPAVRAFIDHAATAMPSALDKMTD